MNVIRDSMKDIRASEELKRNTLEYLKEQRRRGLKRLRRLTLAAASICLLIFAGGYMVYARPVSYISIDVNPSVELGVNCFGRVVEADAYNRDGRDILDQVSLKNVPYLKAIGRLLGDESVSGYLTRDSRVFITVISDSWETMLKEIGRDELSEKYGAQTYKSDLASREEAHRHEMSFGKYRACLELSQYDGTVTVEECHRMSMGEIEDRIKTCKGHGNEGEGGGHQRRNQRRSNCQNSESDESFGSAESGGDTGNDGSSGSAGDTGNDKSSKEPGNDEYDDDAGSYGSHEGHHGHGH